MINKFTFYTKNAHGRGSKPGLLVRIRTLLSGGRVSVCVWLTVTRSTFGRVIFRHRETWFPLETPLPFHLSQKGDIPIPNPSLLLLSSLSLNPFFFALSRSGSHQFVPFKRGVLIGRDGFSFYSRSSLSLSLLRSCRIRIQCKRRWRLGSVIWSLSGVVRLAKSTKGEHCTIDCSSRCESGLVPVVYLILLLYLKIAVC